MTERLRVAILGSTGSIGRQALEVASAHADKVEVVALAAHSSDELLLAQAREHRVARVALSDPAAAERAARNVVTADPFTRVESGAQAVVDLAACTDADLVLNALVGAAGLRASVAALSADKTLALANKESLVVGGELVTSLAKPGQLLPVDSEHSAIFQCYLGEDARDATRIWLTASGGPFRGRTRTELATVTAADALAHPTWTMGPKITIDSSTLMNKGLEAIEAHHLFGVTLDQIRIVVHSQSCVHSMVEYADGSVKAHLGRHRHAHSDPVRIQPPSAVGCTAAARRLRCARPSRLRGARFRDVRVPGARARGGPHRRDDARGDERRQRDRGRGIPGRGVRLPGHRAYRRGGHGTTHAPRSSNRSTRSRLSTVGPARPHDARSVYPAPSRR